LDGGFEIVEEVDHLMLGAGSSLVNAYWRDFQHGLAKAANEFPKAFLA
jgi:hypothetical protein